MYISGNQFTGQIPANIGNLQNVYYFYVNNNQLSGELPSSMGNMSMLRGLKLDNNNLSGSIPVELSNLSFLSLLDISGNNLSGELPASLGSYLALKRIYLQNNNFSGVIPESLSNLTGLTELYLSDNNLSGDFPQSIYSNCTSLTILSLRNNSISGNPSVGFSSNTTLRYLDIRGTNLIQARPNVTTLLEMNGGVFLYDNLSENLLVEDKTNIVEGLTQIDIDNAQISADFIIDVSEKKQWQDNIDLAQSMLNALTTVEEMFASDGIINDFVNQSTIDNAQGKVDILPDGLLKQELQEKINDAQKQLDEKTAKEKVEYLFTDDKHTNIKDTTDQKAINDAQDAVNKLTDNDLKNYLQKEIDKAQDMLNAKDKVDGLFADEAHTDIIDGLTQGNIDDAQKVVDKLPNGDLKEELQKEIDKAQSMLDAKNAVEDLLDKDGNLNTGVTQKEIDKAQDLVNKLPNGELKDQLQSIIDEAQKQLDAQNTSNPILKPATPSTTPTVSKPSVGTTSTTGGSTVNTSDTSNIQLYIGLLTATMSLLGLIAYKRKLTK
nr:toxin Cry1Ac domain D-VI-related protein [Breznakia pachnodae]